MSTKEKILNTALDLFSRDGYTASSIRDICGIVGIKESSLYYHFANKQAILQELMQRFIDKSESFMAMLRPDDMKQADIAGEAFLLIGRQYAERYLLDGFVQKIAGMMMIEQASNAEIRALYEQWFFELPLTFQSGLFQALLEQGCLRGGSAAELAEAYYAPIYFEYARCLLRPGAESESEADFLARVDRHIAFFYQTYRSKGEQA